MILPDFVYQDRRADGIVSVPEILPVVRVGQMFPLSTSGKPADHKHEIGPDDNLLCRSRAQLEGDNRC